MQRRSRGRALAVMLACALTFAGTAGGFAAGRIFKMRAGDRADFTLTRSAWQCSQVRRLVVHCQGGDAFPYVELGAGSGPCNCVSLVVHTLRDPQGGHIIRTYEHGYPVYVFRAF